MLGLKTLKCLSFYLAVSLTYGVYLICMVGGHFQSFRFELAVKSTTVS